MTLRFTVHRFELQPGDVLLDATGAPFLRVQRNEPARARGYRVITGERLGRFDSTRTGGNGDGLVRIERDVPD